MIDSYLGAVAEAETDKGKKVFRIATSTMTSIIEGHNLQNMTLRNVSIRIIFLSLLLCNQKVLIEAMETMIIARSQQESQLKHFMPQRIRKTS